MDERISFYSLYHSSVFLSFECLLILSKTYILYHNFRNAKASLIILVWLMLLKCLQLKKPMQLTIYIYAFSRCFYPKRLTVHSGYTFFISMCVPWEQKDIYHLNDYLLIGRCSFTISRETWAHDSLHWYNSLICSCDSVVEHCVSSAKGCGFNSQGTHLLIKKKSLWIKASAKCINVNVMFNIHGQESWSSGGFLIKACGLWMFNMFMKDGVRAVRQQNGLSKKKLLSSSPPPFL